MLIGQVLGAFWNYNIVEAVLLFSAVLVNLAGLMFAGIPKENSYYDNHKRTITVLLILNVVLAMTYYFVVFFMEFFTKTSAARKCKCCFFCCKKRFEKFFGVRNTTGGRRAGRVGRGLMGQAGQA